MFTAIASEDAQSLRQMANLFENKNDFHQQLLCLDVVLSKVPEMQQSAIPALSGYLRAVRGYARAIEASCAPGALKASSLAVRRLFAIDARAGQEDDSVRSEVTLLATSPFFRRRPPRSRLPMSSHNQSSPPESLPWRELFSSDVSTTFFSV
jgi:hypothetical protein